VVVIVFFVTIDRSKGSNDSNVKRKSSILSTIPSVRINRNNYEFLDGVTYSQLRSGIVARYHASDPETDDIDDQFDDALSAMKLMEQDGLPVPIHGVDGLYIGSFGKIAPFSLCVRNSRLHFFY
jgi:hypothetical protein